MNQPPEVLIINGRRYELADEVIIYIDGPLRGSVATVEKLKTHQLFIARYMRHMGTKDATYVVTGKKDTAGRTILKQLKSTKS